MKNGGRGSPPSGDFVAHEAPAQPPGWKDQEVRVLIQRLRRYHPSYEDLRYVWRRVREKLGVKRERRSPRRLPHALTLVELKWILEQAYKMKPVYGLLVKTLFTTGVRVSELVSIRVEDVDFEERSIRVRGKGSKERVVLFSEDLKRELQIHLNGRDRGVLFESNRHQPISVRRVQQIVQEVARQAGIVKAIHPHLYRHAMATYLHNRGMPLEGVQLLLGHENPRTTQVYAKLSLATVRGDYDRVMAELGRELSLARRGESKPLEN